MTDPKRLHRSQCKKHHQIEHTISTPAQESNPPGGTSLLLNLSQDIFKLILEQVCSPDLSGERDKVQASDLSRMSRVSKRLYQTINPYLYQKIYTKIDTSHNTAWLTILLRRRPEVKAWIRLLILDEYHPRELRVLLSFEMPNLEALLVQHEGDDSAPIDAREMRRLNRDVYPQPKLRNLVFHFDKPYGSYELASGDAILLRHPNLRRLRLCSVNFASFEKLRHGYFQRQRPLRFDIEESEYTQKALERLVLPFERHSTIVIQDCHCLPRPPVVLSIMPPWAKGVFPVLNLRWISLDTGRRFDMYLSILKALKDLWIEHYFFVASDWGVADLKNQEGFMRFVEAKFPSDLKKLVYQTCETPDSPVLQIQGVDLEMPEKDTEMIEAILRQKEKFMPDLKVIFLDCNTDVPDIADELYEIAEEHGVILGLLQKDKAPSEDGESKSQVSS